MKQSINKRAVLKQLVIGDAWMRELYGWFWHRRKEGCAIMAGKLAGDIKRGEKLISKLRV